MKMKSIRATIVSSLYFPIILVLGSIGTALVLNVGGKGVMQGTISYGTMAAFITYTAQFFEPVRQLAVVFADIQGGAQASAERVFDLINEIPDIIDNEDVINAHGSFFQPKKRKLARNQRRN